MIFVPSTDEEEEEEEGGAVTAEEGGGVDDEVVREQTVSLSKKGIESARKACVLKKGGNAKEGVTDASSWGVTGTKSAKNKRGSARSKGKQKKADVSSEELSGAESAELSDVESAELESVTEESSSTDSSEDEEEEDGSPGLFFGGEEEAVVEVWGEEAPLSEDTSRRLALCNMDWDYVGAKDVFG